MTKFSARLICPLGDPARNRSMKLGVDDGTLGAAGVTLAMAQNICTWEGFQINGLNVTESLMTGVGPSFPDGTWTAQGYDFGFLVNGDHYLAQWTEKGDDRIIRGTWKLIRGTGSITGITGEATFEEPAPQPGDRRVVARVTGWYLLPAPVRSIP